MRNTDNKYRNSKNFKNFTHTYSQFLVQSPTLYRKPITIHDRSQLFTHQRVNRSFAMLRRQKPYVLSSKSTFLAVFKSSIHTCRSRNLHRWNTLNKRLKKKVWINKLWNHFYKRQFPEFSTWEIPKNPGSTARKAAQHNRTVTDTNLINSDIIMQQQHQQCGQWNVS